MKPLDITILSIPFVPIICGIFLLFLIQKTAKNCHRLSLQGEWEKKSKALTDHIHKIGGFDPYNAIIKELVIEEYFAYEMYVQECGNCDVKYYQALLFLTDFEPDTFVER